MIDLNHFRDKEDAGWRRIVNQEVVSAMGGRLSAFDTMCVRLGDGGMYGWGEQERLEKKGRNRLRTGQRH
jgi:hypothetical protein